MSLIKKEKQKKLRCHCCCCDDDESASLSVSFWFLSVLVWFGLGFLLELDTRDGHLVLDFLGHLLEDRGEVLGLDSLEDLVLADVGGLEVSEGGELGVSIIEVLNDLLVLVVLGVEVPGGSLILLSQGDVVLLDE